MAANIYLYPGAANQRDIVLRDPTTAAGGGVTITCAVGNTSATGVAATIATPSNTVVTCAVGNAVADAPTAQVSSAITCSVGGTTAVGVQAQLAVGIVSAVGDVLATGVAAAILGDLAIACAPGNAPATGVAASILTGGDSATLDQILAILMGRKVYDSATGLWRVYDQYGTELADPSGILLRGLHGWLLQANQHYLAQQDAQSGVRRLMYYQLQEQALLKRDAERQDAVAVPQTPQLAKKRTVKSRRIVKATPREVVVPMDPAWYNAPAPLPKFSTVDWAPLIKASNALAEATRHEKLAEASNDARRKRRDEEIMLLMAA